MRFDPNLGYKISRTPARVARISIGNVKFLGEFRGNKKGFQDKKNFSSLGNVFDQFINFGFRVLADYGKDRTIDDIKNYLKEVRLPYIVNHIPDRAFLLKEYGSQGPDWSRNFSVSIGAGLIGGTQLFLYLSIEERKKLFYKYDGHWNQQSSDVFAKYVFQKLKGFLY
ncbi:MAG: hypothetical protein HQK53_08400 [Oligoflexia bacterium]|nr:hypothetical protein [Oligoflexia bacterium]